MRTILNRHPGRLLSAAAISIFLAACSSADGGKPSATASADGCTPIVSSPGIPTGSLPDWIAEMRKRVKCVPEIYEKDVGAAQREVMDVYINRQEHVEVFYGETGKVSGGGELGAAVMQAEAMFHELMTLTGATPKSEVAVVRKLTDSLDAQLGKVVSLAVEKKVALVLPDSLRSPASARDTATTAGAMDSVIAIVAQARQLHSTGDREGARKLIERAYLEKFEPVEPLLASASVARVEELVHMRLRPKLSGQADKHEVDSLFAVLSSELVKANETPAGGRSAWFAILSSFLIIVREGLEAVLLVGAMIAYLSRSPEVRWLRNHAWAGAGAGIVFSLLTWIAARTLMPISGGNRELMEGITALIAVAVLLYVSHWIFRRTYMGEWKEFLQGKVEGAVKQGSGLAIAGVAFAAVYREGFETVLFYEALLVDLPGSSVATGFVAGALLITIVGVAIIRLGLKLPLKLVFRATNGVLLFLSVAILGKGSTTFRKPGCSAQRHSSGCRTVKYFARCSASTRWSKRSPRSWHW